MRSSTGTHSGALAPLVIVARADTVLELDLFDFQDPRMKRVRINAVLEPLAGNRLKMQAGGPPKGERPLGFTEKAIVLERK